MIYKSLKRDTALTRKVAIARRLLQVSNLDDPVLACASLYTISAANKDSTANIEVKPKKESAKVKNDSKEGNDEETEPKAPKSDTYDFAAKNPLHSNADRENLWEFILLCRSYHPSVNEFVTSLLGEGDISYNGDPFNDFTRIKFLDKFVFKNPKTGITATNKKFYSKNKIETGQPQVYSSAFREQKASRIHADEQFFYNYFKTKKVESSAKDSPPEEKPTESDDLLDFADDIKTAVLTKGDKKKKPVEDAEEDEEDSEDEGSEFSYGDIGEEVEETETQGGDKAYEKFLWENLDSDGESIKGSDDGEDAGEDEGKDDGDDGWEDIDVDADSDEERQLPEAVFKMGKGSDFVEADALDDIILQHKAEKKLKKRKSKPVEEDSETPAPKKKKGKKNKSDKAKPKK